jgi:hypothetical protein
VRTGADSEDNSIRVLSHGDSGRNAGDVGGGDGGYAEGRYDLGMGVVLGDGIDHGPVLGVAGNAGAVVGGVRLGEVGVGADHGNGHCGVGEGEGLVGVLEKGRGLDWPVVRELLGVVAADIVGRDLLEGPDRVEVAKTHADGEEDLKTLVDERFGDELLVKGALGVLADKRGAIDIGTGVEDGSDGFFGSLGVVVLVIHVGVSIAIRGHVAIKALTK